MTSFFYSKVCNGLLTQWKQKPHFLNLPQRFSDLAPLRHYPEPSSHITVLLSPPKPQEPSCWFLHRNSPGFPAISFARSTLVSKIQIAHFFTASQSLSNATVLESPFPTIFSKTVSLLLFIFLTLIHNFDKTITIWVCPLLYYLSFLGLT